MDQALKAIEPEIIALMAVSDDTSIEVLELALETEARGYTTPQLL